MRFPRTTDNHTLDDDIKMFFALTNAAFDAGIVVWECKLNYDYARPASAIHYIYRHERIFAWGGPGRGRIEMNGKDWRSYITQPPFPDYISGHSAFSAASTEILKQFTGSDAFEKTGTFAPGASRIEPNVTPAIPVTLSWRTFSDAADQAGISRRIGGIHFEEADIRSRICGRLVALTVWDKVMGYINGTAGQQ